MRPNIQNAATLWVRCFWTLCLVGTVFAAGDATSANPRLSQSSPSVRVQQGDDPAWADPQFDDAAWLSVRQWRQQHPDYQGNVWLRRRLVIPALNPNYQRAGLLVAPAASEIYLNGRLLMRNGRVGSSRAEERPGRLVCFFQIPEDIPAGEHVLAVRFSNHHGFLPFHVMRLSVGPLNRLLDETRFAMLPLALLGVFVAVAVTLLVLYLTGDRRRLLLLFAALCLLVGALFGLEQARLLNYRSDWHGPRLLVINALAALIALLLPAFFVLFHRLSFRWWWPTPFFVAIAVAAVRRVGDPLSLWLIAAGLTVSLTVVGRALFLRRAYAAFSTATVAISLTLLALAGVAFLDGGLFTTFLILPLLMLVSVGLQMRDLRRDHQAARLNSARLEIELLKKQLQPHFMMNTLTAVVEWMEVNPNRAVQFIELLAEEMHLLLQMSGRRLIPLSQEVALCRTHLQLMAYRTEANCSLVVEAGEETENVPPAVFHTLIENALTHGDPAVPMQFSIQMQRVGEGRRRFDFLAAQTPSETKRTIAGGGTGTRYIQARLRESFGDDWSFLEKQEVGGWRTVIEMGRELPEPPAIEEAFSHEPVDR